MRRRTNTHAERRRRLPFVVVIDRAEPFCKVDRDEIDAECRRITNGAEFYHTMARFERGYRHVVHFGSAHQADAFDRVAKDRKFATRPVPQFGPPEHEKQAFREAALLWGFRTGAIRRVLRAYRDGPGSLMQRDGAARDVLRAYKMPEGHGDILHVFIEWVVEHHPHWFNHRRHPGYLPFDEFHWVIPQEAYPHSDD
ncbi:MAG TPA: hypothetical protein VKY24_16160 [Reyranella sp.]|nr:hypothetical protein [Reyranella sp.]